MLKNIGNLVKQLKPYLPQYLKSQGIDIRGRLFRCPNYTEHAHGDAKPSCNFLDATRETWYCYACRAKGDIFDALALLEKRDISGENFAEAVKYLCNKFGIPYEEVTTKEEQFFNEIHEYLSALVEVANQTLLREVDHNPELRNLVTKKHWVKSIEEFKLGFLRVPFAKRVSPEVLDYLGLNPKDLINSLIIPIYNRNNRVVGLITRTLKLNKKEATDAAYKTYTAYRIKSLCFNINRIDPNQEVIVVEGPSSVLTLNDFGIRNVVATFGNLLSEQQYSSLVQAKVHKILFLYDGDAGGSEGLRNSLKVLCRSDIDVTIGFLENDLDPGDHVIQHTTLNNIKRVSLYDWLVSTYSNNTNDKYVEKCLMTFINSVTDLVKKEQLINQTSKALKINKSTIADLLEIYKTDDSVNIAEVLKEREALVNVLTEYEKWSWSRGQLLGLRSFKSFDVKFDGIQNGLILVGGRPNIGKSALLNSLAIKLLQRNSGVYLLYFTIDDSLFTTISRFIANLSGLPINVVSNPNHKIQKADLPDHIKQDYINRREQALNFLRQHSSLFNLKDSGDSGATVEMIREKVNAVLPLAHDKQLVVMIDNLHNLRSRKYHSSDRHLYSYISNELNSIANTYKCPVIASTHITKDAIRNKVYDGTALKDTVDLDFDNKLFIMIDTDEDDLEGTKEDILIKVIVAKNKFSAFKGRIDMMFYRSLSRVEDVEDPVATQEGDLFS